MLSQRLLDLLNAQVGWEHYASALYRQASSTVYALGMARTANYLRKAAEEEREHADKFSEYVDQRGGQLRLGDVKAPPVFSDARTAFTGILELEQEVTGLLSQLQQAADEEGDRMTNEFLAWFLLEQIKGEADARTLTRLAAGSSDLMTLDAAVGETLG